MPARTSWTPPKEVLRDTQKSVDRIALPAVQSKQVLSPNEPVLPLSLHATAPLASDRPQSTTEDGHDTKPIVPNIEEDEDEYTLSAYGDISLSEDMIPPSPSPTRPSFGTFQPGNPQPRLRLRVRRPPMPKRRPTFIHVPDPVPHSEGIKPDVYWPGSPRLVTNDMPWYQHQPLVSPITTDHILPNAQTQANEPSKSGGSSLEKLFDQLLPRSPSVRLSPPGSPTGQALSLPQGTREPKGGVRPERKILVSDNAAKLSQSPPVPASQQDKPKAAAWRTRLPPRPPIPTWDI